jgi:hypothetical protein
MSSFPVLPRSPSAPFPDADLEPPEDDWCDRQRREDARAEERCEELMREGQAEWDEFMAEWQAAHAAPGTEAA